MRVPGYLLILVIFTSLIKDNIKKTLIFLLFKFLLKVNLKDMLLVEIILIIPVLFITDIFALIKKVIIIFSF